MMSTIASIHPKLRIDQLYLVSTVSSQLHHRLIVSCQFMQAAQETMSSTASNYDVPRLITGTALALLAILLTLPSLPALRPITVQGIAYTLILTLYCVLVFASSYVEEEHNFWYWATSAWFFYLFVSSSRKEWYRKFILHPAIMLGILHRVIRRWNQTGQKYAGADDIVHSQLLHGSHSIVLWSLIGATYLDLTVRLSRHVARSIATFEGATGADFVEASDANRVMAMAAVLPLGGTAFVFKLAFTARDAPELTKGISDGLMQWAEGLGLVGVARMVFGGILLSAFWIGLAEWKRSRGTKKGQSNGGKFLDVKTETLDK
jgi:ethanolaminephosphotransferase